MVLGLLLHLQRRVSNGVARRGLTLPTVPLRLPLDILGYVCVFGVWCVEAGRYRAVIKLGVWDEETFVE